ncbi:MAG: hypothetical protein ACYT04_39030 [Nostoc sp.]
MVPILASDAIASDEVMSILICHILVRSLLCKKRLIYVTRENTRLPESNSNANNAQMNFTSYFAQI